jgi:hypothetical protein
MEVMSLWAFTRWSLLSTVKHRMEANRSALLKTLVGFVSAKKIPLDLVLPPARNNLDVNIVIV